MLLFSLYVVGLTKEMDPHWWHWPWTGWVRKEDNYVADNEWSTISTQAKLSIVTMHASFLTAFIVNTTWLDTNHTKSSPISQTLENIIERSLNALCTVWSLENAHGVIEGVWYAQRSRVLNVIWWMKARYVWNRIENGLVEEICYMWPSTGKPGTTRRA